MTDEIKKDISEIFPNYRAVRSLNGHAVLIGQRSEILAGAGANESDPNDAESEWADVESRCKAHHFPTIDTSFKFFRKVYARPNKGGPTAFYSGIEVIENDAPSPSDEIAILASVYVDPEVAIGEACGAIEDPPDTDIASVFPVAARRKREPWS